MSELIQRLGFFLCGGMLLMEMLGLGVSIVMPGLDRWSRHFYIVFFAVLTLCIGAFFVDGIVYQYPDMALGEKIAVYLGYLLTSLLPPLVTVYLLHCIGESWQAHGLWRIVLALWLIFFILLGVAQFTTCFYYVTPDNQFFRGPLHPVLLMFPGLIMILNMAILFQGRKRMSWKHFYVLLAFLLPLTVSLIAHAFFYVPVFIGMSVSLCGLSMFALIILDEVEQHMRQQREIAHQRASIMVLQMRPHFIYNTMMSIYYLCKQDPDLAQQVTMDFTTYLRKIFTAIVSETPIPFSEELEHTRAYLAVEQAQFEDRLFVDYDTPHTRFDLPPLTLQPIVENAVKHGMDPDSEPLHISIQTRETDAGSEIIVENTGADYRPGDDREPHIALANIEQRLDMMCGGRMTVTPRSGGGTTVKVVIPPPQMAR